MAKRSDFLKHLKANGIELLRDRGGHSIYWNPVTGKTAAVPRHTEIAKYTAWRICDSLEIPRPVGI